MKTNHIKYILFISGALILSGIYIVYQNIFKKGVKPLEYWAIIYIPTGATYEQVIDTLDAHLKINDKKIFNWVVKKKNYPSLIKPGRYVIENEMGYLAFINMLRSGNQVPVNVTFNNIRNIGQLAARVSSQIEADSTAIASFLSDSENYNKDGFTRENVISAFIPNTYEFYWNTSAEGFYSRMIREYNKFWTDERLAIASLENLTRIQVAILASIVDDEVVKADEKPRIAGVYLNRLRRGIPLQACPTIKFALNDYTITRVLSKHLEIESPYNTYKHRGFPPGPIGCPTIEGIDAVLNAEKHEFLYFAAKADFSGYHNFSRTLSEHNRYADEYQRELDKRRIFK